MTFAGPADGRCVSDRGADGPDGWEDEVSENDGHESDWQPVPLELELPLDDPYRRPPAPAGGERNPDPDGDVGNHVIIIDLA
jgi:hypothetical protein